MSCRTFVVLLKFKRALVEVQVYVLPAKVDPPSTSSRFVQACRCSFLVGSRKTHLILYALRHHELLYCKIDPIIADLTLLEGVL